MNVTDLIVVGAGVAGVTVARAAVNAGRSVVVLEKSRGLGGRCATRRLEAEGLGDVSVDHGAQYVTARDALLQQHLDAWRSDGDVTVWSRGLPTWTPDDGIVPAGTTAHPRYVPPDGMSRLGHLLIGAAEVARQTRVTRIVRAPDGWRLEVEGGPDRHARAVVVTAPAPQALALLDPEAVDPDARRTLASIRYAPSFAWMAGFDAPAPTWPGLRVERHDVVSWIANDGSKRRPALDRAVLVAHATATFSRDHFDAPRDEVAATIAAAVRDVTGPTGRPTWQRLHRWRYALAETTAPTPTLRLAAGLHAAGDGFGGGRVEGAFLSGLAAADAVLDELA